MNNGLQNKVYSWLTTFNFTCLQQPIRFKRIYFSFISHLQLIFLIINTVFVTRVFSVALNNKKFSESVEESVQPQNFQQTTNKKTLLLFYIKWCRSGYAQRIKIICIHGKFSTCTRRRDHFKVKHSHIFIIPWNVFHIAYMLLTKINFKIDTKWKSIINPCCRKLISK